MILTDTSQTLPLNRPAEPGASGRQLDVRVRLVIALATSVAVLLLSHPMTLAMLSLTGAIYMAMLRRWRVQIICYCVLLFLGGLSVLFLYILQIFLPMMRNTSPSAMLVPLLRMLALLHAVMPLALSLKLREVLSVMKTLRFPRALYLPLSVTIRFIPGLVYDLRQIRDCLRLRGFRGWALLRPRFWLLPVIFRCLFLSDELAVSAELKGVGYGRPTHLESKKFLRANNLAALVALLSILAGVLWMDRSLPQAITSMHTNAAGLKSGGHHARHGNQPAQRKTHAEP